MGKSPWPILTRVKFFFKKRSDFPASRVRSFGRVKC